MTNSEAVCNHIKKRKKDLVSVLGGKCCICGFDAYIEALDFHHIDPTTKNFGLGASNAVTKALDKQLEEAKKCVLLCANCHRGVHAGYLQIPTEHYYNEELAQQLLNENYALRYGQARHCQQCGAVISYGANLCVQCNQIAMRTVQRPTREELKDLIRSLPFTQIATKFGVSDNAIRKWCQGYALPAKKKDIKSFSDIEWAKI